MESSLKDIFSALSWLESHSGTTSLVSLIMAVISALFKPSTWRRVVGSVLVVLTGFLFLPYEPTSRAIWTAKSLLLALVFICAFWWAAERLRNLRAKLSPLPVQPSGTFEAAVEAVSRVIAESGDSTVRTRLSTDAGTFTFNKVPSEKKRS